MSTLMLSVGKVSKRIGKSTKWTRKLILDGVFGEIGKVVMAEPWNGHFKGVSYLVPESSVDAYLKQRDREGRRRMNAGAAR